MKALLLQKHLANLKSWANKERSLPVAPATLQVIMHNVVVKVDVGSLLILLRGCLWLLMPLNNRDSISVWLFSEPLSTSGMPTSGMPSKHDEH